MSRSGARSVLLVARPPVRKPHEIDVWLRASHDALHSSPHRSKARRILLRVETYRRTPCMQTGATHKGRPYDGTVKQFSLRTHNQHRLIENHATLSGQATPSHDHLAQYRHI